MKAGLIISIFFSLLLPVAAWKATAMDMREWKTYESYIDLNGVIKQRKIDVNNKVYTGGVLNQYWDFHGLKEGALNWLESALFCFMFIFPAASLSVWFATKNGKSQI